MSGRERRIDIATILKRGREEARAAPPARPAPPEPVVAVLLRPEVLRAIGAAAGSVATETGGPLVGTVQRSWEVPGERLIVSVLATVPPGPAIRAAGSSVSLGQVGDGERAASAVRWWRSVTGLDLRHLGDWHKHPSGLPEPSGGDRATARAMRSESGSPVWLTGIAVGARDYGERVQADGNALRLNRRWDAQDDVRFYRETARLGLVPVPVRAEDAAIPRLPVLPWHVTDPVRFAAECRLLRGAGFRIEIEPKRAGRPGLALRLRQDGRPPVTIVTGTRYPLEAPVMLDGRGRPVPPRNGWSPAKFLVDVAKEMD